MATLTRNALALIVQKDMADPAQPAEEAEGGPKTFRFRANDGDFDRYNDRNSVKGWLLDNYNANPIVLLNHDDGSGGFFDPPRPVMPIGKARAYTTPDALMCEIEFDQDDPLAVAAQRKVEKGYLNAVSVRYRLTPGKYRENERGGYDSDEQELLEISLVNLPGNQRAVRAKGATAEQMGEFAELVADVVLKRLDEREKAPTQVRVDVFPPPGEKLDPAAFAKSISEAVNQHLLQSKER